MPANVPEDAILEGVHDDRKLPVYLLLDTSWSMEGEPLRAVERGVEVFKTEVCDEPFARDTAKVAIITFSSYATMRTDGLVPVADLPDLSLVADGITRLDLAFQAARESINAHVVKPKKGVCRGDWKPIIFVLTDGMPTDASGEYGTLSAQREWKKKRLELVDPPPGLIKVCSIVAVGCGDDVDDRTLKEISTGPAFRVPGTAASFVSLFRWLSQTISLSLSDSETPEDPFADMEPGSDMIRIP